MCETKDNIQKKKTLIFNKYVCFLSFITILIISTSLILFLRIETLHTVAIDTRQEFISYVYAAESRASTIRKEISDNQGQIKALGKNIHENQRKSEKNIETLRGELKDADVKIEALKKTTDEARRIYPQFNNMRSHRDQKETRTSSIEKFNGIGVKFRRRPEGFVIVGFLDRSPARQAGLYLGDAIVKIEGQDITNMSDQNFIAKVRGPKGSFVNLTYRLAGSLDSYKNIKIERDAIHLKKEK
jgi:C-terminal processing protease CtpA/Prc